MPLKHEIPLENATEHPLGKATENPRWFLRCRFLACSLLPLILYPEPRPWHGIPHRENVQRDLTIISPTILWNNLEWTGNPSKSTPFLLRILVSELLVKSPNGEWRRPGPGHERPELSSGMTGMIQRVITVKKLSHESLQTTKTHFEIHVCVRGWFWSALKDDSPQIRSAQNPGRKLLRGAVHQSAHSWVERSSRRWCTYIYIHTIIYINIYIYIYREREILFV